MKFIMVLNDGETYTDVFGCAIVAVPDDADIEAIEEQLDDDDGNDYVMAFETDGDRISASAPGGGRVFLSMSYRP